jgi:DNA-binding transcriptional regulator YdaS (Cro superfamily)
MRLATWLDENEANGKTRKWLCEQLGVHAGTVDKWCNGTIRPRLETILQIQKLTDSAVSPEDWAPQEIK